MAIPGQFGVFDSPQVAQRTINQTTSKVKLPLLTCILHANTNSGEYNSEKDGVFSANSV